MATSEAKKSEKRKKHKRSNSDREYVTRPRERKQRKHYNDDWALADDDDDEAEELSYKDFDLEDRLTSPRYDQPIVKEMHGSDLTVAYFQRHGFSTPLLFKEKTGLGLGIPSDKFTINDVRTCVGSRRVLDVMDVNTQKNTEMTMREWQKYYENPNKDRLLNVISLEFSHTKLENHVQPPTVVRQVDWVDCVWPRHLKEAQTEATNALDDMMYPKVQRYCLMSVKGCYTDFHIDFGGTSVWYHILKGGKVFWLIPPTDRNLEIYEEWVLSGKQNHVFLGDVVEKCGRVHLQAGNTFFIPSGWIHAVYTPKDSLIFGGNFLHSFAIEKQLRIAEVEDTTKVPQKFRYPYFTEMLWYVLERYVHCLLGNSHLNLPPEEESRRNSLRPHGKVHLTLQELYGLKTIVKFLHELPPHKKNVPELIINPINLITDVRDVIQNHFKDNQELAITGRHVLRPLSGEDIHGPTRSIRGTGRGRGGGRGRGRGGGHNMTSPPVSTITTASTIVSPTSLVKRPTPVSTPTPSGSSSSTAAANTSLALANNNGGPRRRRTRCKKCDACMRSDCGECAFCLDMTKFGGTGRAKQTCIMRQCLQPMLPVTAACTICKLDGWGKEPVIPIQKTIEKNMSPSSLMECSICYEIIHPNCVKLPSGCYSDGQHNDDMPNSWECPKCCTDGKNSDHKPRHFRARNKQVGNRRESVSSESSSMDQKPIKDETDLSSSRTETKSTESTLTASESFRSERSAEVKRIRHSTERDSDSGAMSMSSRLSRPVCSSSPAGRPPLRSQLAAQLCGSSTKQLKKAAFVVRPAPCLDLDTFKQPQRLSGANLCLERTVITLVFRYLNNSDLCRCMLVCKAWATFVTHPSLWKTVSLAQLKVTAAHLQGIVRRQPISLNLNWSTTNLKQLGWLLQRLPQLQELSLQGCSWPTCVVSLKTCSCPPLIVLDLSFVTGLYDSCMRNILGPPEDSRPGLANAKPRLRNLKTLKLSGTCISDVSLRYIVQYIQGLETLIIDSCVKITDDGIAQLSFPTALTSQSLINLDISGCTLITNSSLNYLSRLQSLETLSCLQTPLISSDALKRFAQDKPNIKLQHDKKITA